MKKNNRKLVEVLGALEWVDILDDEDFLKMNALYIGKNFRYIGTDFQSNVDVYEDCATGKFLGVIN